METLREELEMHGGVRQGEAVLRKDSAGYHMRNSRNLFGCHRHDLPLDASIERLEAHWAGFVANVRADVPEATFESDGSSLGIVNNASRLAVDTLEHRNEH